jgi:hypothetical protein
MRAQSVASETGEVRARPAATRSRCNVSASAMFAIALDRCGWMIVQQPQGDRKWFMKCPSDACPEWADNDVPKAPPPPQPRLRVIDGGKNETAGTEPQSQGGGR